MQGGEDPAGLGEGATELSAIHPFSCQSSLPPLGVLSCTSRFPKHPTSACLPLSIAKSPTPKSSFTESQAEAGGVCCGVLGEVRRGQEGGHCPDFFTGAKALSSAGPCLPPLFPLTLRVADKGLEPPTQSCISHRLKCLRKNGGKCGTGLPGNGKGGCYCCWLCPGPEDIWKGFRGLHGLLRCVALRRACVNCSGSGGGRSRGKMGDLAELKVRRTGLSFFLHFWYPGKANTKFSSPLPIWGEVETARKILLQEERDPSASSSCTRVPTIGLGDKRRLPKTKWKTIDQKFPIPGSRVRGFL